VVAHGVHYQGIDERRLVPFARALAQAGLVVLTPELQDLTDYRVTQRTIDEIADAVAYLSSRQNVLKEHKVGLLGFSFAGGLALVAAAQPELEDKLAYAVSVGGHHDLSRVLQFLTSSQVVAPEGTFERPAHEYGLVVLVYEYLERFVPEADRAALTAAFRAWLQEDRAAARAYASERVTEDGEKLFSLLERQQLSRLRPKLESILQERQVELAGLSPRGRLHVIRVPVYLLHGAGDSVIPPSEAQWAALELGKAPHALLVTPLIEHVQVERTAGWKERLELVRFMSRLL
jgi:pimeloyl-ACP methyl ester carboxylesterase